MLTAFQKGMQLKLKAETLRYNKNIIIKRNQTISQILRSDNDKLDEDKIP